MISMIYGGACPNPFDNPLLLRNPYPYSLNSPLTYLEIPPLCLGANPVHSDPWLAVYWPPPFLLNPFFPSPTVPHFKYMSSYDNIATSASDSPKQGCYYDEDVAIVRRLLLWRCFCGDDVPIVTMFLLWGCYYGEDASLVRIFQWWGSF